jgi:hypothetical protein
MILRDLAKDIKGFKTFIQIFVQNGVTDHHEVLVIHLTVTIKDFKRKYIQKAKKEKKLFVVVCSPGV